MFDKNDIRFYRVGGGTRIAGFLLGIMTVLLLWVGTTPLSFIRTSAYHCCLLVVSTIQSTAVMVVGALIFALGIDLIKEALWDTRHRATRYYSLKLIALKIGH